MKVTFFKDNKLTGEHEVDVQQIIKEFLLTPESKWDQPFESLILNFMANKYGSYDKLSDAVWDKLYLEYKKQR